MPMNRATLELFAPLDRSAPEPLRAQLEDAICAAITGGGAPPGTRLPASRALAEALHVSRGVVSEAYAQIAAEGWIEIRRGSAPVVRAVPAAGIGPYGGPQPAVDRDASQARLTPARGRPPRLDLTATAPDLSRVPAAGVVGGAAAGCSPRCRTPRSTTATRAGTTSCGPSWRRIWCGCGAWWRRRTLVVTSGYTQGLWLTCRALKARGATTVAVEDPSLDDSWATIRSAGLEVVGLPVDEHGLCVDALDADAVLVTPAHQFPTGAVLAPERRRALLAWGGIVIEDDYDSEYRYDRAPVGTLQRLAPDRVVYLGTTSKTLAPALRLGWLVAPPALAAEIARERWAVDSGGPAINARAYARLLATGEVDRHLRRTRREYRERRDRLVAALESRLPECRVTGRRRRPAPAAAAPAGHGRGGGGRAAGGAADPDPRARRLPADAAAGRARAGDRLRPAPARRDRRVRRSAVLAVR